MLLTLLTLSLAADPEISLLTYGLHHGSEVKTPGQGWLALFDKNLAPVTLKTKKVRDEIIDDGKPESVKTGIEVTSGKEIPIVYIKGLSARSVTNFPLERQRSLGDGKAIKVGDGSLAATGTGPAHQLVLTLGAQSQVLYEQADGDLDGWTVRWIGDLDGDGKLDLLVEADHHYNVTTLRLFLSSQAAKGDLVKEVAKYTTSGC